MPMLPAYVRFLLWGLSAPYEWAAFAGPSLSLLWWTGLWSLNPAVGEQHTRRELQTRGPPSQLKQQLDPSRIALAYAG
jgi:hypothetical protein